MNVKEWIYDLFLSSYCATQLLHINSGSIIMCSESGKAGKSDFVKTGSPTGRCIGSTTFVNKMERKLIDLKV